MQVRRWFTSSRHGLTWRSRLTLIIIRNNSCASILYTIIAEERAAFARYFDVLITAIRRAAYASSSTCRSKEKCFHHNQATLRKHFAPFFVSTMVDVTWAPEGLVLQGSIELSPFLIQFSILRRCSDQPHHPPLACEIIQFSGNTFPALDLLNGSNNIAIFMSEEKYFGEELLEGKLHEPLELKNIGRFECSRIAP